MTAAIYGMGTALPPHTMTQDEAIELAQEVICQNKSQARLLDRLYRMAGVSQRQIAVPFRTALEWIGKTTSECPTVAVARPQGATTAERMRLYEQHAPPLATTAASRALSAGKVDASEITHLVTVSCTGFSAPGVDHALIKSLKLSPKVERVNVGFMGCHGAINGLRVAKAIVESVPTAKVLLCAVELCSLHYQMVWDPERMVANALFADGAAAAVLGTAQSAESEMCSVVATGSLLLPESAHMMEWFVGEHGFEMSLSPGVPDLIESRLRPWLEEWLAEKGGLSCDKVNGWAVHPGGPRVIAAVEKSLGLDAAQTAATRHILANCGNMSSPTVLFILDRLHQLNGARSSMVAIAFGPGLTAEVALFRRQQQC